MKRNNIVIAASASVLVLSLLYIVVLLPRQQRAQCNSDALYNASYDFKIGEGHETIPVEKDPDKNGYNEDLYKREYSICLREKGLQ